jgi:hypothetical protein
LSVTAPDSIVTGQPFTVTVQATTLSGAPDATWSGAVTLSASAGTLSPATIQMTNGAATAQATLTSHAGAVTLRAAVGAVNATRPTFTLSGEPVARLEVAPTTILIPGAGQTMPLTVRAYDANNRLTTAAVTWQANDAGIATVSPAHVATAVANVGSTQLTAAVGTVRAAPVLAVVTPVPQGTMLVADAQVVGTPVPADPNAAFGIGWRYIVRLTGAAPQVGQAIVASGATPIAGRVVAVQTSGGEHTVTIEFRPFSEILPQLSVTQSFPLTDFVPETASQRRIGQQMLPAFEGEFDAFGFGCKVSAVNPVSSFLTGNEVGASVTPTLSFDLAYTPEHFRFVVTGQVQATVGVNVSVAAAIDGKVDCRRGLGSVPIPVGGPLAVLMGARVRLGVGFALDGKLTLANAGFEMTAAGTAGVELGVDCHPGCAGVLAATQPTFTTTVKPNFPDPGSDFRIEVTPAAFLFAELKVGPPFFAAAQVSIFDVTAGGKQKFNVAPASVQAADATYASNFELVLYADLGPGESLNTFLSTLGLSAQVLRLTTEGQPLARSPAGSFQVTPAILQSGENATFTVSLNPVTYLAMPSVDRVEIYRKAPDGSLVAAPGPCAQIAAAASTQTSFVCQTSFPSSISGPQEFYAFVKAKLLGVSLPFVVEVGPNSKTTIDVCAAPAFASIASDGQCLTGDPVVTIAEVHGGRQYWAWIGGDRVCDVDEDVEEEPYLGGAITKASAECAASLNALFAKGSSSLVFGSTSVTGTPTITVDLNAAYQMQGDGIGLFSGGRVSTNFDIDVGTAPVRITLTGTLTANKSDGSIDSHGYAELELEGRNVSYLKLAGRVNDNLPLEPSTVPINATFVLEPGRRYSVSIDIASSAHDNPGNAATRSGNARAQVTVSFGPP